MFNVPDQRCTRFCLFAVMLKQNEMFWDAYIVHYGTGSYPLPPQGWHLPMRLAASQPPLSGPCFLIAPIAYWLQVGAYLQAFGRKGPNVYWYIFTKRINIPLNNCLTMLVKLFIIHVPTKAPPQF